MAHRILIVDDEEDIREFIRYNLVKAGYEVRTARDGEEALSIATQFRPHLILLDVMMPVLDGIETCRTLRADGAFDDTFILFLSALDQEQQQIAGYDVGAEDYITKPVSLSILLNRIQAILKRTPSSENHLLIDPEKHLVHLNGKPITLPRKEFDLLGLLASAPGRLFTREEIYNRVWGNEVIVGDRTIDVHIRKLRQKIGDDFISTVKGVGYKFIG